MSAGSRPTVLDSSNAVAGILTQHEPPPATARAVNARTANARLKAGAVETIAEDRVVVANQGRCAERSAQDKPVTFLDRRRKWALEIARRHISLDLQISTFLRGLI